MFYSLLLVLVIFCAVVGVGLASNNVSAPAMLIVSVIALAVLQVAYVLTLVFTAMRG